MRNLLIFTAVLFYLSACKSLHKLPEGHAGQNTIEKNKVGYDAVEARAVITGLEAAKGSRLTILLRVQQDSLLGATVYAMGMKVAALKLSGEDGLFVNYLKNNYLEENTDNLRAQLDVPLQLGLLQQILLADYDIGAYRLSRKQAHYTNRYRSRKNYTVLELDTSRHFVQEAFFFAGGQELLHVSYATYKQVKENYIPKYISFVFEQEGEMKKLELKYTAFETVGNTAFELLPPPGFTRMTLQDQ